MTAINILIVDDGRENSIALNESFVRDDITIFSATSSVDALTIALKHTISIVLIDMEMKKTDGWHLATSIKSNPAISDIAIIMVCSPSNEIASDVIGSLGWDGIDFLYKPLSANLVTAKVKSFVKLCRLQQQLKQKNEEFEQLTLADKGEQAGSGLKSFQNQPLNAKENNEYGKKIKETFLANMSHELRTPVNGIIGLTNLLRKTTLNEQQSSMIDLLEVSSKSLLGVINDILDISKMEAGKFSIVRTPNNVHDLIRSVYGLLKFKADEHNIEFILRIASDVPTTLMVDSLRLNQVLMNLLSNAIKFTEKGYVKLEVSVLEKERDNVKLLFLVEDSGIGIASDKLSTIFDSFEQAEQDTSTKYGGTGLGLAIVKKLVELKGGEITVSSELGKGSTFKFTNWYTIADKPKEKTSFNNEKPLGSFENVKILVAEDNLVNQFMLAKMLKDWDIDVEMVDNGQKAIEKLQANDYDLILMDTHMPEMNGYQTAKKIRFDFAEPKRSIPIISLSAASFDYEQEEAILSGMNDVLSKPFQPGELHRKIMRLLKVNDLVKNLV